MNAGFVDFPQKSDEAVSVSFEKSKHPVQLGHKL